MRVSRCRAHRKAVAGLLLMLPMSVLTGVGVGQAATPDGGESPGATAARVCPPLAPFDRANFPDQPRIDNQYLPLTPGWRTTLEGVANRGQGVLPHRVTFTVTDLTKVIDGVRNRVVFDIDQNEGQIAEQELAFFAQDSDGNVWNFGEYPEEYEAGTLLGAPSTWVAGQARARAGIHMPADPQAQLGQPYYLQGLAPAIDFLDCARVAGDSSTKCVPTGCYDNALVTVEKSPLEDSRARQIKSHAAGVGIFKVGFINDPEGEVLVLVKSEQLSPEELAQVRAEALALDKRAYDVAPVYGPTPPAEPPPAVPLP